MKRSVRQAWLWWSVGLLAVFCGVLAYVQYRWTGEIMGAQKNRLRQELVARLEAVSRGLDDQLSAAARSLVPSGAEIAAAGREQAYGTQFAFERDTYGRFFSNIALAIPARDGLRLVMMDLRTCRFSPAEWPARWGAMRQRLERRALGGDMGPATDAEGLLYEIPRFGSGRGPSAGEQEWLLLELDEGYLRSSILPAALNVFLSAEYDLDVTEITPPHRIVFQSTPSHAPVYESRADATAPLLDLRLTGGPPGFGRGGARSGAARDQSRGRWQILARSRAGSLETLVARTRRRNLLLSGAILLVIMASGGMLVRLSRRMSTLAEAQFNFVAGVSHEFRTPLTVIRTAAYNLRNAAFRNQPEHLAQYGKLIEDEAGKLQDLVEQVLRFASVQAGHPIGDRALVSVDALIEEEIASRGPALQRDGILAEISIQAALPSVYADGRALRQALGNLLDNAMKYGTNGGAQKWIGVYAESVAGEVRIRVVDRGMGIPPDEQARIFDPFFRGRRALEDHAHGTGLGLSLVKQIAEAHGGSASVRSNAGGGTEFVLRLPAASQKVEHEPAHSAD